MARDSFLDEILKRLAGKLDPDTFEDCAVELLRETYATLVLVPGGRDSGRDGLLAADREDGGFLVCTTQKDPLVNLRRSLRSHKAHLKPGSRVLFATNQALGGEARDQLREAATAEGYELVQCYDQRALAHRLYRHPEWCNRLLDLAGEPPSLSKHPMTERPLGGGAVIGREEVAAWVLGASSDCLLSGQPGSGKTFLLYDLCARNEFYFVVGEDVGRIADEVRAKAPAAIILDDAHTHLELLRSLVHFRKESGASLRIIATCWPAEQTGVAAALQASAEVRELDRLTRDQIVEVIHTAGIAGPQRLVHELVNQADGRPGLAVTLCHVCLAGGVRDVGLGEALAKDTRRTIRPLGPEAYDLLAGLAIGGDAGMELLATAHALRITLASARAIAVGMAAAGVLHEVGQERLAVRPHALRHALVRDVFFSGALARPPADVIAVAPNAAEVANTLSGARARGGRVPIDLVIQQVERGGSPAALATLAWVGPEEARAALDRHPECLPDLARPCLEHIPEAVIPKLLNKAVGDERELNQATDHPLRMIGDWIRSSEPGSGDVMRTRQTLHRVTLDWLKDNGDVEVGVRSLMTALSPRFDAVDPDPGSGRRITIRFGSITSEEAGELGTLWAGTLPYLQENTGWSWAAVQALVDKWCHPGQLGPKVPAETCDAIRRVGEVMLRDLVSLASGLPGVQQWLLSTASRIGVTIDIQLDPAFLIIYPLERVRGEYEEQEQTARALAREWAEQPPPAVVSRLIRFATEADRAQIRFPRYDREAWWELAKHVEHPLTWAREVIASSGPPNMLWPFLHYASTGPSDDWQSVARTCLGNVHRFTAADVIFEAVSSTSDLLEQAAAAVAGTGDWAEIGSIQSRYTMGALRVLLRHEDPAVAAATAMGIWHRTPRRRVPDELLDEWRAAVIRGVEEDHDLEAAFEAFDGLATDWLRARIDERSSTMYRPRGSIEAAVRHLKAEERINLLESLDGSDYVFQGLISALVDDAPPLLRGLLSSESLRPMHLEPFRGQPNESWAERAVLALNAGYSPEDLVQASYSAGFSWSGNLSDMWQQWASAFEKLASHNDPRLKEVSQLGVEWAHRQREDALKEERDRDVFGR